ncbi:MAG: HD domain-containing protein [Phycisphaerae bacterium]
MMVLKAHGLDGFHFCDMGAARGSSSITSPRQRCGCWARANWPDPRMRSVVQLAERCGYRRQHAEQVVRPARACSSSCSRCTNWRAWFGELLKYACLLHDVGYLISHRGHHKHSYYLIHNGGLQGFDAQEIELIANVRYHRKGRPRKSHYSYQHLDVAVPPRCVG